MVVIPEPIRLSGVLTPPLIAEAVTHFHRDGIVVLSNAIDPSHISILNAVLSHEAHEIADDPFHHFNFGTQTRNMDQAPPVRAELMFKDVWANPFAAAVLAAMLGPRPVIHYANGNTALKAEAGGRQPVHSDVEFVHPTFPFAVVVNISLVDVGFENGATEVWVGSHRGSSVEQHVEDSHGGRLLEIKEEFLRERRAHSPPVRACTRKGSLVLRDLRLWHAGMPNRTEEPRVMLAFVAQPAWYQGRSKVILPESVRELVEGWEEDFGFRVHWVQGEVDHKKISSEDVDFDTENQGLLGLRHLMHLPEH
ncbi:MAG: hypothetical protein M1834_008872 [Cirrosporium novae-zelandiae]|nr:MAG: hypothetical protein M1834_008872 [Cirrosporium novae-zelandiae]